MTENEEYQFEKLVEYQKRVKELLDDYLRDFSDEAGSKFVSALIMLD